MKPPKSIKAFTLSELIVVLILTSIVVGLAFSVLGLVQKQVFAIQKNYSNQTTLRQLETSLWIDMHRYPNSRYDALEDELIMKHELDSVIYTFTEKYIIKKQDTFPIQLQEKVFYLDGKETSEHQIDAIKLVTDKTMRNQSLFIFKTNDASQYMNQGND